VHSTDTDIGERKIMERPSDGASDVADPCPVGQ